MYAVQTWMLAATLRYWVRSPRFASHPQGGDYHSAIQPWLNCFYHSRTSSAISAAATLDCSRIPAHCQPHARYLLPLCRGHLRMSVAHYAMHWLRWHASERGTCVEFDARVGCGDVSNGLWVGWGRVYHCSTVYSSVHTGTFSLLHLHWNTEPKEPWSS
jgi:hypothetical protein